MWNVVYRRKPLESAISETLRYTSRSKFKAFLVYLFWRTGYHIGNYEIRQIQIYKSDENNVISIDDYRRGRR